MATHCHPCSWDQKGHHIQVCRLKKNNFQATVQIHLIYLSSWSRQFLLKFFTKVSLWWHKCMGCLWHLPRYINKLFGHISKPIWRVEAHMPLQSWPLTIEPRGTRKLVRFLQLFMPFTDLTHIPARKDPFTFIPTAGKVPLILNLHRLESLAENSMKLNKGKCRVLQQRRNNPMHHCRLGIDLLESISEKELEILLKNFKQKLVKIKSP